MKAWKFKVKSNSQGIIKKLDSALGSVDEFVFNTHQVKNDTITFKLRQRVLYAYQMILRNKIIVNGKIINTDTENETDTDTKTYHLVLNSSIKNYNFSGSHITITYNHNCFDIIKIRSLK